MLNDRNYSWLIWLTQAYPRPPIAFSIHFFLCFVKAFNLWLYFFIISLLSVAARFFYAAHESTLALKPLMVFPPHRFTTHFRLWQTKEPKQLHITTWRHRVLRRVNGPFYIYNSFIFDCSRWLVWALLNYLHYVAIRHSGARNSSTFYFKLYLVTQSNAIEMKSPRKLNCFKRTNKEKKRRTEWKITKKRPEKFFELMLTFTAISLSTVIFHLS